MLGARHTAHSQKRCPDHASYNPKTPSDRHTMYLSRSVEFRRRSWTRAKTEAQAQTAASR